jgi:hypothetical protein
MSTVHPAPASVSEAVAAALAGGPGSFTVSTEALLRARNVLQTEYERLSGLLSRCSTTLVVRDCGTDPVSSYASVGFNEKIGLIVAQANAYVQSLRDAADQLDETVRGYGATDEQIKASFDAFQQNQAASARPASALPDLMMAPSDPFDPAASLRQYTPARTPADLAPLVNHPPSGPASGPR